MHASTMSNCYIHTRHRYGVHPYMVNPMPPYMLRTYIHTVTTGYVRSTSTLVQSLQTPSDTFLIYQLAHIIHHQTSITVRSTQVCTARIIIRRSGIVFACHYTYSVLYVQYSTYTHTITIVALKRSIYQRDRMGNYFSSLPWAEIFFGCESGRVFIIDTAW